MAQKTLENELKELENIVARLFIGRTSVGGSDCPLHQGLGVEPQLRCVAGRCPPDSRNGKNAAGGRNQ